MDASRCLLRRRLSAALLGALGLGVPLEHAIARPKTVHSVSLKAVAGGTQIDLALDGAVANNLFTLPAPDRVVLDLSTAALDTRRVALPGAMGLVRRVRSGPRDGGGWRFVFEVDPRTEAHRVEAGAGHLRIQLSPVSESAGEGATRPAAVTAPAVATAGASVAPIESSPPTERVASAPVAASENPPPAKAVSVKSTVPVGAGRGRVLTIAVDAGHGGDDPGASGPDGTHEKDVTLAIARELASRINAEPGMRAVLTRPDDHFVPLRERINRARHAQADLFVSVHADAVPDHSVSGASVYVLSARGATNEAAKWLADRENAADLVGGISLDDKDNVLASVLLDLSQSAAMSASMFAAEKVLSELNTVGEIRKTKVQQAGFVVLKSPDIPSMLIETAYITNPGEEKRLRDERYQQKLAGAILAGIRNYFHESPLPGTRLAALRSENSTDVRTR
jgi:N-acetylmuramoyl-L-alanine amidase